MRPLGTGHWGFTYPTVWEVEFRKWPVLLFPSQGIACPLTEVGGVKLNPDVLAFFLGAAGNLAVWMVDGLANIQTE